MSVKEVDDPDFKEKFTLVEDVTGKCKDGEKVFRANLKNEEDIMEWIEGYAEETFTGWIVSRVKKEKDCNR